MPALTRAKFLAWLAAICLQAGALELSAAIDDANYTPNSLLVRKFAYFTNAILDSIPTEVQSEAIHGSSELHLYPLRHVIQEK